MVWRITVLDDEIESIQSIEKIIRQYFITKNMDYEIYTYQEPEVFLKELPQLDACQLFLLDMELPQYTGLQIAKKVRLLYPEPYIIYITNHVEYAPDAFEVNAFRYIPKRLAEEKLPQALDRLNSKDLYSFERAYVIQTNSNYESILYRNIYYLYKAGKYVVIVHSLGTSKVRKTLQEVHSELNSEEFIFIDKGYVANIIHIMKFKNRQITMRNQEILPVSAPRAAVVREQLAHYAKVRLL